MKTFDEQTGMYSNYTFILTNKNKTTLYILVTSNLSVRLQQHKESVANNSKTFVGKYKLQHLIYYEKFKWIQNAIAREKELKGWRRVKKIDLIRSKNENFDFLDDHFPLITS